MGVVEAMVAGGITVMEVTMTVPGAIDVLRELKRSYGSKLLLGRERSPMGRNVPPPSKRGRSLW